jgi:hypothetical protein
MIIIIIIIIIITQYIIQYISSSRLLMGCFCSHTTAYTDGHHTRTNTRTHTHTHTNTNCARSAPTYTLL